MIENILTKFIYSFFCSLFGEDKPNDPQMVILFDIFVKYFVFWEKNYSKNLSHWKFDKKLFFERAKI